MSTETFAALLISQKLMSGRRFLFFLFFVKKTLVKKRNASSLRYLIADVDKTISPSAFAATFNGLASVCAEV